LTVGNKVHVDNEDIPSLPTGLLNHKIPNVFHLDETVEVSLTELTTEELFRLWEVIVNNAYQISVPYVACNVKIESRLLLSTAQPLQERIFDVGKLNQAT
jgi:hypothetical protein